MPRQRLHLDPLDPDSPRRDDWIAHVDADGKPNGLWSRVLTLESSDRREEMYEVLDEVKSRKIITRYGDNWIEVILDG